MPKFRVEVVYAYEIEAESKDKAEQHGQDTRDYVFELNQQDGYDLNVRVTEVTDAKPNAS